ncbi:hypothetical protein ACUN0C_08570 [Faunimonas sp. B44]|uniref:hypothetical protein n=1 Tax=Faunimonas sp. B44 TaxID=3461493 RepID=UPI004044064E
MRRTLARALSAWMGASLLVVAAGPAIAAACGETSVRILTPGENRSLPPGTVAVLVRGAIAPPLAEDLERLLERIEGYDTVILDLDSAGGELAYAERVSAVLGALRERVLLRTYVRHGSSCLSSCVLVFMQGEERVAGGASAWLFHGVCRAFATLPLPRETARFVERLAAAGVSGAFLSSIEGYLNAPGEFWLSGYELHAVREAGIITTLLAPWRPLHPSFRSPPGTDPG